MQQCRDCQKKFDQDSYFLRLREVDVIALVESPGFETPCCLACIETRLQRPLTLAEFPEFPDNDAIRYAWNAAKQEGVAEGWQRGYHDGWDDGYDAGTDGEPADRKPR